MVSSGIRAAAAVAAICRSSLRGSWVSTGDAHELGEYAVELRLLDPERCDLVVREHPAQPELAGGAISGTDPVGELTDRHGTHDDGCVDVHAEIDVLDVDLHGGVVERRVAHSFVAIVRYTSHPLRSTCPAGQPSTPTHTGSTIDTPPYTCTRPSARTMRVGPGTRTHPPLS